MLLDPSPVAPLSRAEADPEPLHQPARPSEVMHRTRAVHFFERRTPIVYQNCNGPYPLFSICNLLLLKGVISLDLDPDACEVSQEKLISLLANLLTNILTEDKDDEYDRNREQNVENAIALLPRLATGIDMNPMFRKIDDFEFTPQRVIFDLLDIPLYHGWMVDSQDTQTATAIGSKSYNALVSGLAEFKSVEPHKRRSDLEEQEDLTRVLNSRDAVDGEVFFDTSRSHSSSTKETPQSERDVVLAEQADKTVKNSPSVYDKATEHQWELIENFLQTTANQLTVHGLFCLHKELKENELCVLFHNNHFNTMFKHSGSLYLLVNDQAYISHTDLVWQRLDEVNGDGVFHTSNFTVYMSETPRNDSQSEQQAIRSTPDYLAQFDNSTSGNHACNADPMDMLNGKNLSRAPASKLLTFDASVAYGFIAKKEWEDLDDYLSKFIATILKKTPDEVVMMHPGLFMIPREERLLDMLSDQKYEEADSFCQKSIDLLRGCQGRFIALDLLHKIDELNTTVKTSSMPALRRSAEDIETRILDYIHLYFPSAICRDNAKVKGLWQFAMKLPKPDKQGQKVYHKFRCLACGWVSSGQRSILHQRSHLLHSSEGKSCPKVTQDLLDRLRAIDETRGVPTLKNLKDRFRKKRKSRSSDLISEEDTSSTGSNTSILATRKNKRSRACNSPSLGIPAIQMKPIPAPMLLDKDTNPLLVGRLKKEAAAFINHIIPSVVPDSQDRLSLLNRVVALQQLFIQLSKYALVDANHFAPKDLLSIVGLYEEAADAITERIIASVIPDAEDRIYFMERVAALQQVTKRGGLGRWRTAATCDGEEDKGRDSSGDEEEDGSDDCGEELDNITEMVQFLPLSRYPPRVWNHPIDKSDDSTWSDEDVFILSYEDEGSVAIET